MHIYSFQNKIRLFTHFTRALIYFTFFGNFIKPTQTLILISANAFAHFHWAFHFFKDKSHSPSILIANNCGQQQQKKYWIYFHFVHVFEIWSFSFGCVQTMLWGYENIADAQPICKLSTLHISRCYLTHFWESNMICKLKKCLVFGIPNFNFTFFLKSKLYAQFFKKNIQKQK